MTTAPPRPLTGALTRRRFLAGLGAAGLLAGCGTSRPVAATAAGPGTGFPRSVRHEVGETRLDGVPARIASVTDGAELGALLALGVAPVAYGQRNDPLLPWIVEAGGDDPAIQRIPLPSTEVDFERLAALGPDAIVGQYGFVTEENIGTFQGIAPTVATSFIDWRASLRQVAEATGTEERAGGIAAGVDAELAAAAERLAAVAGTRVAVFTVFPGNEVYALNAASPAGEILAAVGAAPLPAQQAGGEAADPVSAELVGSVLECDVALVQLFDDDRTGYDAARQAGLFDGITAFRTGRVVELPDVDAQTLYFSSVLTVPRALDVLERALAPA